MRCSNELVLKEDRGNREVGFGDTWENSPPPGHYGDYGPIRLRDLLGTRTTGYLSSFLDISTECAVKSPPLFILLFVDLV